jgi:hypothetical protein
MRGYLLVVKWFFKAVTAEGIRNKGGGGRAPLIYASNDGHHFTALWLFLQDAANDENSGHVNAAILSRDVRSYDYDESEFEDSDSNSLTETEKKRIQANSSTQLFFSL